MSALPEPHVEPWPAGTFALVYVILRWLVPLVFYAALCRAGCWVFS